MSIATNGTADARLAQPWDKGLERSSGAWPRRLRLRVAGRCLIALIMTVVVDGAAIAGVAAADTTAPQTTITSGPVSPTKSTTAILRYVSSESGSRFECRLDSAAYATCPAAIGLTELAVGSHTFMVRAIDAAGNVDATPATKTWTIDTTAPQTTITSGPVSPTKSTTAILRYVSSESGSRFECRLDSAAYATCPAAIGLTELAVGSHTFMVRAIDAAGNVDATPATKTWTIDTTAPQTTITSAPPFSTSSATASFSYSSSETGSRFECKLDSAAYAACASPTALTGLSPGSHTFSVRAIDAAGNVDATPATKTWTIDTTAPQTTITSGPVSPTKSTTAILRYVSSESGSRFECRLDSAAYATCPAAIGLTELAVGSHTFMVRAIDAAGNVDATPATKTWTIDTTAPQTTITSGPVSPTKSTTAILRYVSSESGSRFECRLDSAAYATCPAAIGLTELAVGSHTFMVRAIDAAGNVDATPATKTWTIDTTAPQTTITSAPPFSTSSATASFSYSSSETGSRFECKLDSAAYAACASPTALTGLSPGSHTFSVRAIDAAGNVDATPATAPWLIIGGRVNLCGQITSDRTLSPDEAAVYVITCNLTVPSGSSLNIEAGTMIKSDSAAIAVEGTLMFTGRSRTRSCLRRCRTIRLVGTPTATVMRRARRRVIGRVWTRRRGRWWTWITR